MNAIMIPKIIFIIYLVVGFTWFFYLAAMHLKHNKENINPVSKIFGYPWILFAYVLDVLFNWIVGTILFVEFPKELLFTTRVSRHIKGNGWQSKVAIFCCKYLLDPFDPSGLHCK